MGFFLTYLPKSKINKYVLNDNFRWYYNKLKTRMGKMKQEYILQEKRRMIEATLKKKNVNESQLKALYEEFEQGKNDKDDIAKLKNEADEIYADIVNKLLAAEDTEEYVITVFF